MVKNETANWSDHTDSQISNMLYILFYNLALSLPLFKKKKKSLNY